MLAILYFYAVLLALTLALEPWVRRLGVPLGAVLVLLGFVGSEAWVAIGGDTGLHWRWFDDLIFHLLLPILIFEGAYHLAPRHLLRAWRSFARLQNPAAALGWMKTIVRRENARRFERIQPRESAMPAEELPAQAAQHYDTSTEAFVLRRAIRALPTEYREPLILQVLHGYSQQEIAARLGLSAAGAGTRLFRARQRLREALGERG